MESARNPITPLRFGVSLFFSTLFYPVLILGLSGNWRWVEGWILGIWFAAMVVSSLVYMYFKDPALLVERSKAPGGDNQKSWDVYVLWAVYLLGMTWLVIMPLDAGRFHWSPVFPQWVKIIGTILLIPALFFIYRATADNTFMSTRVRAQHERKQRVITTGVYAFVRHPLYLGCVLMMIGAPMLLSSFGGLGLAIVGLVVLVGRIIGEEKMMINELEGYEDYKKKVRYRLFPGIW